jgi:hypothetical protein
LVSNDATLPAALGVSLTNRSSPTRKFGAAVCLLAMLAIIFDSQKGNCPCGERQRARLRILAAIPQP